MCVCVCVCVSVCVCDVYLVFYISLCIIDLMVRPLFEVDGDLHHDQNVDDDVCYDNDDGMNEEV